jgi:hypothetical protein
VNKMTKAEVIMEKIAVMSPETLVALEKKWADIAKLTAAGEKNYARMNATVGQKLVNKGYGHGFAFGTSNPVNTDMQNFEKHFGKGSPRMKHSDELASRISK